MYTTRYAKREMSRIPWNEWVRGGGSAPFLKIKKRVLPMVGFDPTSSPL